MMPVQLRPLRSSSSPQLIRADANHGKDPGDDAFRAKWLAKD